jgi:cytoskeleton protein RodZ
MSAAPDSLGGRLKAERERKGFSAQKAADQLHLDAWVIEALESGDYARIGPAVYGKGHLKRYAGLLGLPPEEIIGAYENRAAALAEPAIGSTPLPRAAEPAQRAPPRSLTAGFAVMAVAAAVLSLWRPWQPPRAAPLVPPAPESPASVSAPDGDWAGKAAAADGVPAEAVAGNLDPADGALRARSPVTVESAGAAGASGPVAGVGRARLRLSFSADSWVDVRDASGRRLFAGRGHANSVKTIAGAAPMKVYLGFVSGVQLEVNNHVVAIGREFVAGDVAHFEAGADGVLRRDVRAPAAGDPHPPG